MVSQNILLLVGTYYLQVSTDTLETLSRTSLRLRCKRKSSQDREYVCLTALFA